MLGTLVDRLLVVWILAQDPAAPPPAPGQLPADPVAAPEPGLLNYLPLVGVPLLIMWLFFLNPDRQAQKRKEELAALKKNDKVITIGGLHGIVANVSDDDTVQLRIDEQRGVVITVTRAAISQIVKPKEEKAS